MPKITIIKIIHFTIDFLLAGFQIHHIKLYKYSITIIITSHNSFRKKITVLFLLLSKLATLGNRMAM